jgi:hypothetical protein
MTDTPSEAKPHRIIASPVLLACRVLMLTRMIAIGIKGCGEKDRARFI